MAVVVFGAYDSYPFRSTSCTDGLDSFHVCLVVPQAIVFTVRTSVKSAKTPDKVSINAN